MSAAQERASDFNNIERRVIKIREACIRIATRPVIESPISSVFVAVTAGGTVETSMLGLEPEFAEAVLTALDQLRGQVAAMVPESSRQNSNVLPLRRAL